MQGDRYAKVMAGSFDHRVRASRGDNKATSATYITSNDVQSTLKGMPADKVTDQQVRMINTGKQNVGIGVVHRSAQAARRT
jgi:hypothetical protein